MNYKQKLAQIRLFVFDVDGVMTDGSVHALPGMQPYRVFNTKDGYAVARALEQGLEVAIISGGLSEAVRERFHNLGCRFIYLGKRDKVEPLEEIPLALDLSAEQVAYLGDDLPDLAPMALVGLPCAPQAAAPEVKEAALYVSPYTGGKGCVRDLIEQTLRVQGKWGVGPLPQ